MSTAELAPDSALSIHADGTIADWDGQARAAFGWSWIEAAGAALADLILRPQDRAPFVRRLAALQPDARAPLAQRFETVAVRRNGEEFPAEFLLTPVPLDGAAGFRVFVRDISESRRMERMKREFIATVSHELRTPLTSIRGSLGLLQGGAAGPLSPQARPMIEIAYRNSERLILLVNDILDLEKIESGRMALTFTETDLAALVSQTIESMQSYAATFGVTLRHDPSPDPSRVRVDTDRLAQVLTNLISNAVKFSPKGETVTVSSRPLGDQVRVSVADRGPGIPHEFRGRIFQRFAQADSSDTRQKGGTGLGLCISKAIMERLQGRLDFESEPGLGSTFMIDLPVLASETPDRAAAPPRILHVEDDPLTRRLIRDLLQGVGDIRPAATLGAALREIRESRFDLVILDVGLPDGDGLDVLVALADAGGTLPRVLLFTAGEVPGYLSRLVSVSLSKQQATPDRLLRAVQSILTTSVAAVA